MAYFVYRSDKSEGAADLVRALRGKRLTVDTIQGMMFTPEDVIVCWGARLPVKVKAKVLNNQPMLDKLEQIHLLVAAGVPTVEAVTREPSGDGWLGRRLIHEDGDDLLGDGRADFWVRRENIVREVRVHSFNGVSIRAGERKPDDENSHPWIRTYKGGWHIDCTDFRSTERMREIAHAAVKALGLDFGAVDIAELSSRKLIVLEVNRSPGYETDNTFPTYARAIKGEL